MVRRDLELQPTSFLNMREIYLRALEELARPYPSIKLSRWPIFMDMTGGFRAREFSIFCGPTGVGKTAFLSNLSAQLLKDEVKHFVMSVETGATDYMKRIVSALCGYDVNTGAAIHPDTLARIHTTNAKYLEADTIEFALYEDRLPVEQLLHDIRFMVDKGCRLAIIDNLNFFLEVTRAADTLIEMDRVIHELIILCKQVDIHLIMVMHPKKTEHGRVLSEFDIKGSSTAVQEAHNVFLFNPPDKKEIDQGVLDWSDRELRIQKMRRRGKFVGHTIVFTMNGATYEEKARKSR